MNVIAGAILVAWIYCVTWSALLAEFQREIPVSIAAKECRHDLSMAMGLALIPPMWVFTPFITGFYEPGLKWSCP